MPFIRTNSVLSHGQEVVSCPMLIKSMMHRGVERKRTWMHRGQRWSRLYSFTIKDSLPTLVSTLCSCRGHGRAGIQQAVVPCQEVLCKAHGESLQHQSACTEVVNWLISAHYSDPSGTWVPFRALRAGGGRGGRWGGCELGEGQASKKKKKMRATKDKLWCFFLVRG